MCPRGYGGDGPGRDPPCCARPTSAVGDAEQLVCCTTDPGAEERGIAVRVVQPFRMSPEDDRAVRHLRRLDARDETLPRRAHGGPVLQRREGVTAGGQLPEDGRGDHRRQCGDAVVEVRSVDGHTGQCRQRARLEGGSRREGQSGPSPLAPRWCGLPERFEETRAEEPERIRDVRSAERFPDPLFSPRAVLVRELRDQRPAHRDGGSALHQLLEVQPVSLRCLQSDGRQRPTVVQVSPETQERSAITLRARRDQDVHCVCDLSADRVDLLLEPVSLLEEVRGQLLVEVQCIPGSDAIRDMVKGATAYCVMTESRTRSAGWCARGSRASAPGRARFRARRTRGRPGALGPWRGRGQAAVAGAGRW